MQEVERGERGRRPRKRAERSAPIAAHAFFFGAAVLPMSSTFNAADVSACAAESGRRTRRQRLAKLQSQRLSGDGARTLSALSLSFTMRV